MQTIINSVLLLLFITSSSVAPNDTVPSKDAASKDIVSAFSASYMHENAKAYEKAIQAFDLVYNAGSYPINLRIGWLHYLNGDLRQSQEFYQQAVALAPGSVEAMLGYVLPLVAEGKWPEVIAAYKTILSIDPNNSVVNYRLALIYANQKEYVLAHPYAQKVTALYPFNYDGQLLLAKIEIAKGNILEAKNALMVCLQFNPKSKEALEMWELVK